MSPACSQSHGEGALPKLTAEPDCYGNQQAPLSKTLGAIGSNQVEEDSINGSWKMEGGAVLQNKAPLRLCSINTLANTMKHCINVSNYGLVGRMCGGGG